MAKRPRKTEEFTPLPSNPNLGTGAGDALIEESLKRFGATRAVVSDRQNVLLAGNHAYKKARDMGIPVRVVETDGRELVVVRRTDLDSVADPQKAMELAVADNRTTEVNLQWDKAILREAFGSSEQPWIPADWFGASGGLTDEESLPPRRPTEIQPNSVFALGDHRVACGDSTDAALVGRLLADVAPKLMVTDPPYGVSYDPARRNARGTGHHVKVLNDDRADWSEAWALFPGATMYVWHGSLHAATVIGSIEKVGFELRAQIIWAKPGPQLSRGHYHWQHEPCYYAVRRGATSSWRGDRKQTTLWAISKRGQDQETDHGTQKPVECMRRPILNNSDRGDVVYDPFCGSGTTLVGAEQTGRRCYAVELDPTNVQVIIDRWEAFSGQRAEKIGEVAP